MANKYDEIMGWSSRATKVEIIGEQITDDATRDAFGRLRVGNPQTLFDSKQIFDNQLLFWDDQEVSGTGTTSVHSVATASTIMSVSASTAGRRIRQTYQRFNYQPGKSQKIILTGTLQKSGGGQGITRGYGYYDDQNGLIIQEQNGEIYVVIRSSVTGTPVDTKVPQHEWNIDKMDGTGQSKVVLDKTKSHILLIDFEWLGIGRVRFGFVIDGKVLYVHQFNHTNIIQGVYMSTPNLPVRYEIESDGTNEEASIEHICSTVISEGGSEKLGVLRHQDSGVISGLGNGNVHGTIGIRLKNTHYGASVVLESLSVLLSTTNDFAHWELRLNPTVAGTVNWISKSNSAIEYSIGTSANIASGGIEIDGGFFSTNIPTQNTTPNALRLGASINGTPDEIWLIVIPLSNNVSANSSVTWRELS